MDIIETIKPYGGILENDHFVYASGAHGSAWINKDALTPNARLMQSLTAELSSLVQQHAIDCDVIVGPAMGGIFIGHWMGYHLDKPAVYFDRDQHSDTKVFECHRHFDRIIQGRRVLLVDDVINTGFTLRQSQQLITELGGETVAVAALIDRGNVPSDFFNCPLIYCATYRMPSWSANDCQLCQQAVPVNTDFAHGREFMLDSGHEI